MHRFVFLLISFPYLLIAQSQEVLVEGRIIEAASEAPVPYATVVAKLSNDEVINGTTSLEDGSFSMKLNQRDFRIEISFMGFETKVIRDISISKNRINLGEIKLKETTEILGEVEVQAEKSTTEFKLDKRIFNVGADISSKGLSALEVLNNVPSVTVNIEGEINLRGNSGVQILINGKPSVLADEGGNALSSISSDMIERIEVITNPSAKYQAEGTAGIINIVLKEEEKKGLNGSLSANTGIPANHSIGFSLNRRTEKFNLFTQGGAGYRSLPRYNESRFESSRNDTSTLLISDGIEYRNEEFYNITLGADYHVNDLNVITLAGSFAYEIEDQPSETRFQRMDEFGNTTEWTRLETTEATNPKYQYDLQYAKDFKSHEDHKLLISTLGSFFGKNQSSLFEIEDEAQASGENNQRTQTNFKQEDYTFKLDYTNPFNDTYTLETGAQYDMNEVGNDFAVFNDSNGVFLPDSGLINEFIWNQKVLGVYATGAFEKEKWGVKLGLRIENTDLSTLLVNTQEENNQNYTNLFPSFHTSYEFSPRFQVQGGYSKRVFRPRLWDLNPFFNIRNNYNIRQGNPDLQPEFSNSYEITGVFVWENLSLNTSLYRLFTYDIVERVARVEGEVTYTMPMNLGTKATNGLEMNFKYYPNNWFTLSGDMNYGLFIREGSFEDQSFDFTNDQYNLRTTSKFKLKKGVDLEVSGMYESAYQTIQGSQGSMLFADAGIRKKLWDGKGVINLGVRDIFASRIRRGSIETGNSSQTYSSTRGRFITLGFSYGFGKGEAMTYSGRRR